MECIDVQWHHANMGTSYRLVSELDDERFEVRKMEFFSDGKVGFAFAAGSLHGTQLGSIPVPSVDEINAAAEFTAKSLAISQFNLLWQRHVPA